MPADLAGVHAARVRIAPYVRRTPTRLVLSGGNFDVHTIGRLLGVAATDTTDTWEGTRMYSSVLTFGTACLGWREE